jgi:hypothetical protein
MNAKTTSVSFGRARLPQGLAGQFMGLKRGLRGRTVAFIILAHTKGLDVPSLVSAATEMRRLGVLLNQSLRVSRGNSVDTDALASAVKLIGGLWP